MRIISGTHKGRILTPPNTLPVRPTTDRAKEGLFNILDNRYFFKGKNVLDLFSGTGNIAFEFASRGCEDVLVIDQNINCTNYIQKTSHELGFNINIAQADCLKYLRNCKQKFNFIFADPPYHYEEYENIKNQIFENKLVKEGGILIIEHSKDITFKANNIELRKYGTIHFSMFSF